MSSRRESPALGDSCPVACQIGEISMYALSAVSSTALFRTTPEHVVYAYARYLAALEVAEFARLNGAPHVARTVRDDAEAWRVEAREIGLGESSRRYVTDWERDEEWASFHNRRIANPYGY
jgi:hypothetical protein